mmetsp:Transcript_30412/g.49169  ORF Transcript_30412/g.49169 Transcript_30412/m.49169 type:complete len:732 (-) Transcript_30412:728-2923(-)
MTLQIFRRFLQVFPLVYLFVIVCFCTLLVTPELYSTPSTTFVGPPRRNIFISTSPRSDGSGSSEDGREDVCHGPGQLLLNNHREAYVTVVFEPGEGFMKAAELMAHSLRLTNTSRPIIAMVTKFVNTAVRMRLLRAGFVLHDVDPLSHPLPRCAHTRWTGNNNNSELVKMRVWEIDCMNKIVYLDSDMLIVSNIDDLFQREGHPVTAVRGVKPKNGFNAGMMVLNPSRTVFNDMMSKFVKIGTYDCGDQGFLNRYFKWSKISEMFKLPTQFNRHNRFINKTQTREELEDTRVLHFSSLQKPWTHYGDRDNAGYRMWWNHLQKWYVTRMDEVRDDKMRLRHRIITEKQDWIRSIILPLIPSGAPVALLDYPDHKNIGDQAIWIGEQILLQQAGIRPVFECAAYISAKFRYHSHDCDFKTLRERLGADGVILLHGGGNFQNTPGKNKVGFYQSFRHKVLEAFPNNKVIFMPQTLVFEPEYPDTVKQVQQALKKHKHLTMLFRDVYSYEFAKEKFPTTTSYLCPDLAFLIGMVGHVGLSSQSLFKPGPFSRPHHKIVWISRRDKERVTERGLYHGEFDARLGVRVDWKNVTEAKPIPTGIDYTEKAALLVARGLQLLSTGQVIISDRLHSMILGVLLGKTVVALDNNYGKLSKYFHTFLHEDKNIFWAEAEPEAVIMASMLALGQKPIWLEKTGDMGVAFSVSDSVEFTERAVRDLVQKALQEAARADSVWASA